MTNLDYLTSEEQYALLEWHAWLEKNPGDRMRLRRAEHPEDILLTQAFFNFLTRLSSEWREERNILISATLAGVLAHIQRNNLTSSKIHAVKLPGNSQAKIPMTFAEQLATPLNDRSRPPLSELYFQQLLKSETIDDFYCRLIKAIHLLENKANIIGLANDIIHWHQEYQRPISRHYLTNSLAIYWATDYYTALQSHFYLKEAV